MLVTLLIVRIGETSMFLYRTAQLRAPESESGAGSGLDMAVPVWCWEACFTWPAFASDFQNTCMDTVTVSVTCTTGSGWQCVDGELEGRKEGWMGDIRGMTTGWGR